MTRFGLTMIVALSMPIWPGSSHALEANDTMAAWQRASAVEKGILVDRILKGRGGASRIIKCLDAASAISGHGDLPIRQVIAACESFGSEPV